MSPILRKISYTLTTEEQQFQMTVLKLSFMNIHQGKYYLNSTGSTE